jgi:hypothetical protein
VSRDDELAKPPALDPWAPCAGIVSGAERELEKLSDAELAGLLELFERKCLGKPLLSRQDEPLRSMKGGKFGSIRTTLDGNELRLIYAHVKRQGSDDKPAGASDLTLVALVAWKKKVQKLPKPIARRAQQRLKSWLAENPGYKAG